VAAADAALTTAGGSRPRGRRDHPRSAAVATGTRRATSSPQTPPPAILSAGGEGLQGVGGSLAPRQVTPHWSPTTEAHILQAVAEGVPAVTAAQLAGVPLRTWAGWEAIMAGRQHRYSDGTPVSATQRAFLAALAERIALARAQFEAKVARRIAAAAEAVNDRTGIPEWRAGAWLLEHHPAYKRDYAEYRELKVEQAGTVSHEHRLVQQLPEAEVLQLASPELAELV
jgi:hypothetical protein